MPWNSCHGLQSSKVCHFYLTKTNLILLPLQLINLLYSWIFKLEKKSHEQKLGSNDDSKKTETKGYLFSYPIGPNSKWFRGCSSWSKSLLPSLWGKFWNTEWLPPRTGDGIEEPTYNELLHKQLQQQRYTIPFLYAGIGFYSNIFRWIQKKICCKLWNKEVSAKFCLLLSSVITAPRTVPETVNRCSKKKKMQQGSRITVTSCLGPFLPHRKNSNEFQFSRSISWSQAYNHSKYSQVDILRACDYYEWDTAVIYELARIWISISW